MNLVQIQERLKDAPMQAVMQYANGTNPMVPPYLALAELKRRESVNKSAQMQQDMAQGQQPSVKEQVEQAAGLAALRQQMQQEGMQNLMSQVSPRAIPENVPQPERQPTSEGISSLPVRDMYNFRGGGIVAFQGGGFAEEMAGEAKPESREERRKPTEEEVQRTVEELRRQGKPVGLFTIQDIRAGRIPIAAEAPKPVARPVETQAPKAHPPAIRSAALEALQRTQRAAPSPQPTTTPATPARGIASLPGSEEAMQMILGQMRVKPSLEEAAAERKKAEGLFGLTQPYGEERMKRAQAMEAARQQELESRGMERLMRVMGGIGARGLAGASPAYLQSIEQERAADAAFRRQMDELMGGVEEKRRAEAMTGMTAAQQQVQRQRELGVGAAEKIFDVEQRRKNEEMKMRMERELRAMQPNEAMIMMNVMADIRRRNPDMPEAEVYAKAREAAQGVTPEIKREQLQAKAYNEAAKMWEEMLVKPKDITREQWIEQEVKNRLRMPSTASVPSDIDALLKKYGGK